MKLKLKLSDWGYNGFDSGNYIQRLNSVFGRFTQRRCNEHISLTLIFIHIQAWNVFDDIIVMREVECLKIDSSALRRVWSIFDSFLYGIWWVFLSFRGWIWILIGWVITCKGMWCKWIFGSKNVNLSNAIVY